MTTQPSPAATMREAAATVARAAASIERSISGFGDDDEHTYAADLADAIAGTIEALHAPAPPADMNRDALALETARAIEDEYAKHHAGGRTQRLAKTQVLILAALERPTAASRRPLERDRGGHSD